jgi:hypothetical protein
VSVVITGFESMADLDQAFEAVRTSCLKLPIISTAQPRSGVVRRRDRDHEENGVVGAGHARRSASLMWKLQEPSSSPSARWYIKGESPSRARYFRRDALGGRRGQQNAVPKVSVSQP